MNNKYLKRTLSWLIILVIFVALIFGASEIIDLLKTPILEMTVFHAVLVLIIARVIFWESKTKWKW